MLRSVQQSSIEVYYDEVIGSKESAQESKILSYLSRVKRATGRMIANELGMETSTVSARVNDLVKNGKAFRELSLNECPVSERRVHWIYLQPQQQRLI
jgi:DNA-binding MarR family transcriptional regulator